jgi:hypothetical protein
MRRFFVRRPSPAMAVAFVALLAALSGTAVALPGTNTVDSADIKNGQVKNKDVGRNAVTATKVKNGSLTGADAKDDSFTGADINESTLGQVPSAASAGSANTANTANSATTATTATTADKANSAGTAAGLPGPLASGQTLRGQIGAAHDATAAGHITMDTHAFPIPLASAPTVHIIGVGALTPAGCSGNVANPGANSGHLCIFLSFASGNVGALSTIDPSFTGGGKFGFSLFSNSTAIGRDEFYGTWAVTG